MKDDRAFPTLGPIASVLARPPLALLRAMKWLWRPTWGWVAGLAGLLVLAILAHTIATIVTGRELEAELRKLRAAGEPLTRTEMVPETPPFQSCIYKGNAAFVYQHAFIHLPSGIEEMEISWALTGKRPLVIPAESLPPRVTWADVERIMGEHQEAVDLLKEAAGLPECHFPVNWEAGEAALFPHLGMIHSSARFLDAKAVFDARRGQNAEAISDVETTLRMADQISAEPTLIAQLVRYACQVIALRSLNQVMEICPLDEAQSGEMYRLLAKIDQTKPFVRAMKGLRCEGLWIFDTLRKRPRFLPQMSPEITSVGGKSRAWSLLGPLFLLWRAILNKDEAFYLRYMERQIRASSLPYPEVYRQLQDLSDERAPKYAIVTRVVTPFFSQASAKSGEALATIGLAQWGLAINVFQIREGRWPKSLDEVRRALGWKLPVDPFSGKGFVYRLEPLAQAQGKPQGYLLYSIGPNLRDEGGQFRRSSEYPRLGPERPDDLVWRVRRPGGS
jgi:hypothetical protein